VLCGFQAAGTRGRSLADGASSVRLHGRDIPVRCTVVQLTSMSVHADADDLVGWVDRLSERPDHVYVVHGEPEASEALARRLRRELDLDATVPAQFDEVALGGPVTDVAVERPAPHRPEG
jgi:metallo-beta-lactamase family protein